MAKMTSKRKKGRADPRRSVSKKTRSGSTAKRRAVAVRHARKMAALRGADLGAKRKKSKRVPKHKHVAKIVLMGTPGKCASDSQSLLGGKGITMPKKSKVSSWFRRGKKSRRGGRLLSGSAVTRGIGGQLQAGAVTVAGAAIGSMVGARIPLPAQLAQFRGLLPIVAGVALGASKFGKGKMGSSLALGMIVAGGLAIGRQYAPQVFAGEDEMLGLPQLNEDQLLGLEYQSGEEDTDLEGLEYQNGEDTDDVEIFGEFSTAADL